MVVLKKIEIRQVFNPDNGDDEGFGGDYIKVQVLIDHVVVQTYGDYYHDKGDSKAEAFVHGYIYAILGSDDRTKYTVERTYGLDRTGT
jgi:hypothetical protein